MAKQRTDVVISRLPILNHLKPSLMSVYQSSLRETYLVLVTLGRQPLFADEQKTL